MGEFDMEEMRLILDAVCSEAKRARTMAQTAEADDSLSIGCRRAIRNHLSATLEVQVKLTTLFHAAKAQQEAASAMRHEDEVRRASEAVRAIADGVLAGFFRDTADAPEGAAEDAPGAERDEEPEDAP